MNPESEFFQRDRTIQQGNRVKKSCGNKACQEIVVPGGDFAPLGCVMIFVRYRQDQ